MPTPNLATTNPYTTLANNNNEDNYAIVNSGASDNYLTPSPNVKSKSTIHYPIQVTLPDKSTLWSSHTCQLDIPLPNKAKQGYILPGMKNHSLILVTKMWEACCKVLFSQDECIIIHKATVIMKGQKNKHNGLWYIPIHQSDQDTCYVIYDDTQNKYKQIVNSVYHTTTLAKTIPLTHLQSQPQIFSIHSLRRPVQL